MSPRSKTAFFPLISGTLLLVCLQLFTSGAKAQEWKNMAGPAFSDPTAQAPMPADWQAKAIEYEEGLRQHDMVITLDQHLYPALVPIITEFARTAGLKIAISEGTCGITAGKLARKEVDIGGFCCPPSATDRLPGLRFHTIGVASLALFVHPGNPVANLSLEEARQVFAGRISRWSELRTVQGQPGPETRVVPVGRLHCKTRPGHWRLLLDNRDLFSPTLKEVGSIKDMLALVAENPGAIGYEVLWNPERYRQKLNPLAINGISPADTAALAAGRYPLYRVYNITTWEGDGPANALAEKIATHLLNQMGDIDSRFGIIPAARLKTAGWQFAGAELIGPPR